MEEIWKAIPKFEGLYEASTLGRIRSVDRIVWRDNRWGQLTPHKLKGRVLRQAKPKKARYWYACLSKGNHARPREVHRFVIETFRGPCPKGMECCHNDGNPANNRLDNLRWDTRKNNHADKAKHGTLAKGENCPATRYSDEFVAAVREVYDTGQYTQREISAMFGCSQSHVQQLGRRTRRV